jgi:Type IV pilin-like G and H, putative
MSYKLSPFSRPLNNINREALRKFFGCLLTGSFWIGSLTLPALSQVAPAQMKLAQLSIDPMRIENDAKKWTSRLLAYQESYYKEFGVFASDLSQLDKVADKQYGLASNLKNHQFYDFVLKESSGAVYSYSIPKTPKFMGYASAMFFERSTESKADLQNIQLFTCHGSKKGDYPSEPIIKNGRTSCSMAKASLDSSNSGEQSSTPQQGEPSQSGSRSNSTRRNQNRVQDAVIKEVQKTVPKVINKILR